MNGVLITGIIVGGFLVLVLILVLAGPAPAVKRPQHSCYFAGVHVSLGDAWHTFEGRPGIPAGRKIGEQGCSGAPEYSYAVTPMHPAHVLTSVKVCPAHVGSLHELAAALGDGETGYWLVPND